MLSQASPPPQFHLSPHPIQEATHIGIASCIVRANMQSSETNTRSWMCNRMIADRHCLRVVDLDRTVSLQKRNTVQMASFKAGLFVSNLGTGGNRPSGFLQLAFTVSSFQISILEAVQDSVPPKDLGAMEALPLIVLAILADLGE